ncbi:hypothetical protein PVAP13_3KG136578 [Panicum virgatum]|uniref:Uncharacterized protein n=1 Tax=Panicum virgatum TaxID=38727 RepID=A0A8T0UVI6_PANVG|nr:hypothetical protein PVAP13_3KG136578 [Panicum virgatum]
MPDAMVVVHGSQQSATNGTKRNNEVASATISVSTKRQKYSSGNNTARVTKEKVVKTTATARIKTLQGGSGTLSLEANVPTSQASSKVIVQVTSGHASAEVMAQEPGRKKLTPRRARPLPRLLLSPDK